MSCSKKTFRILRIPSFSSSNHRNFVLFCFVTFISYYLYCCSDCAHCCCSCIFLWSRQNDTKRIMQYKIQFNTFAEVEYCEKYQIYNNKNKIKIKSINTKKKQKHHSQHTIQRNIYKKNRCIVTKRFIHICTCVYLLTSFLYIDFILK